ncbi:MAG: LacI family DNA-binding transcriptional regulator [Schleiferilactobacillus perolens]|uniref:LacI family DNA-binding transcriptional regulator n=1 Tax=Schleiferilactobacillus perolens TaxID=100468 RepID=UPI0039EA53E9
MKKTVSIRDVAALAGTSVTTVSLILNGKGERFSSDTTSRVLASQKKLGYYADFFARGLVGQESHSLGIIVPQMTNPFFAELADGIAETAKEAGYFVQVFDVSHYTDRLDFLMTQFVSGTQRGLVLAAPKVSKDILQQIAKANDIPYVLTDQADGDLPGLRVSIDEQAGGHLAIEHLLSLGHRHLAIVLPANLPFNLVKRFTSYCDALTAAGIDRDQVDIIRTPLSRSGGYKAATQIVQNSRVTGVVAINDDVAIGIMKGLADLGKGVPTDYSVIGYDDTDFASYVTPRLTTIHQPVNAIGRASAQALIAQIDRRQPTSPAALPVSLVVRHSTQQVKI